MIAGATTSSIIFLNCNENGVYYCVVKAYENYRLKTALTSEAMTVNIEKLKLTILADNKSIDAGGDAVDLTYTLDRQLIGGDSLSGALACEFDTKNPGSYKITLGTLNNDNYDITFVEGVFTVKSVLMFVPLFIPLTVVFGIIGVLFIVLTIWIVVGRNNKKPSIPF